MRSPMHKEDHMQVRLTPRELLTITDIDIEALKSMRRRHQIAIAFGGEDVVSSRMYTACDAVALMISSALAKSYGASLAAALTRASADVVLIAIAQAGVSKQNVPLAIIDLTRDDGRRAYITCTDAVEPPNAAAAQGYVLERVVSINVSHIFGVVRANATRIGLDLSAPFLPEPGSETFDAMMGPFVDANLMGSLIEAKSLRKRDMLARKAGAQARAHAIGGIVRDKVVDRRSELSATAA
jgi:hypothetical protein